MLTREELRPFAGMPVHITGYIQQVGAITINANQYLNTLRISQIIVNDDIPIEYGWVTFGPTGTKRIHKWRRKFTPTTPIRLDAKIGIYETKGVPRLGLSAPHNAEVFIDGKWRCVIRGIERYAQDTWEEDGVADRFYDEEREYQTPTMEALRQLPRKDKAIQQMLNAFFVRREIVSERQLQHARKVLDASHSYPQSSTHPSDTGKLLLPRVD